MGQRALVADDDPLMRRVCLGILKLAGCEVIMADNGREAVDLATRELPHLIIMDVMMAEMNGLEALRRLKLAEATRAIPVIMITAQADRRTQEESASSGAAAYLIKPFRAGQLLKAVRRLLPEPVSHGESD